MTRLRGFLLVPILFFSNVLSAAAQAPGAQELSPELRALVKRLDAQASGEVARDNVGSVTLGVVSGANLVWTKSYGWADSERKFRRRARPSIASDRSPRNSRP